MNIEVFLPQSRRGTEFFTRISRINTNCLQQIGPCGRHKADDDCMTATMLDGIKREKKYVGGGCWQWLAKLLAEGSMEKLQEPATRHQRRSKLQQVRSSVVAAGQAGRSDKAHKKINNLFFFLKGVAWLAATGNRDYP